MSPATTGNGRTRVRDAEASGSENCRDVLLGIAPDKTGNTCYAVGWTPHSNADHSPGTMLLGAWTLSGFSSAVGFAVVCHELILAGSCYEFLLSLAWVAEILAALS